MTSEGAPVAQNNSNTNNTDVPSTSSTYPQQATCCANHANLQNLKQKKIDLEKKLNEKCKLLSQIIRDESSLLKLAASNSAPVTPNSNTMQSSIRRKIIGTSFKLPENLLNSPPSATSPNSLVATKQKDEINQLLLEKKLQQQISEAALKLANDVSQTKSIRKTHRQCHDSAQEKLKVIEKNILLMQLQHTATENGKHIVRHNSIKITMPMSVNQPARYHQPNEKLNPAHYPYTNSNTIPSISMAQKQVYNTSKDAKIKKSAFLDSEYNYTGNQMPIGTPPYNDVQYLAGDIISPNYINPMDDDFAQYPTGPAVYHNSKLKQSQYQNGGLGGYWYTENNERIWCTMDNRFSSLDRKTNQIVKTVPQKTQSPQQPTKSTSLGNFEFILAPNLSKHDEGSDSISISSINSENKKPKDKVWSETSLDSPTVPSAYKSTSNQINNINNNNGRLSGGGPYKAPSPQLYQQHHYNHPPNPPSQSTHHRTNESSSKPKLSSHSMSLPNRNFIVGSSNPNHMMPYDDLYLTTPPYPDYYQSMQPLPDGNVIKSPTTSRIQNNRIMTSSPTQSQQQHPGIVDQDPIRFESPKNITVIQQAKFRPYKEISKPFEMADFYKYSTKFRQKNNPAAGGNEPDPTRINKIENKNRNDLDDLNLQAIQKIYYQAPNPSLCQPINYQ